MRHHQLTKVTRYSIHRINMCQLIVVVIIAAFYNEMIIHKTYFVTATVSSVTTIISGITRKHFCSFQSENHFNPNISTKTQQIVDELRGGSGINSSNDLGNDEDSCIAIDIGSKLAEQYGIDRGSTTASDLPSDAISKTVIYGGSLKDALESAKQQGRLLVILIPQQQHPGPSQKKNNLNDLNDIATIDVAVVASFLSTQVAMVAEQAPPKKKKKSTATTHSLRGGSFLLWSCTAGIGSSDAITTLKRVQGGNIQRTNAAGQKRPILLVVYPHSVIDPRNGQVNIVPRLLAQHHCTPPPNPEKLVQWLRTIRKRSFKYYAILQKHQQELLWQQERIVGYKKSVQSDIEHNERAILEAREKQRIAEQEKVRVQYIQQRRKNLLEALNNVTIAENDASNTGSRDDGNVIFTTVALRFGDGRTGTRRFTKEATLQDIFHWVDAIFEIERESVILQTMNGKRTFYWHDDDDDDNGGSMKVTILDSGLGKMFGLRVNTKSSGATTGIPKNETTNNSNNK
jgi:UBX domain